MILPEATTRTLRAVTALEALPTLPIVAVKIGEVIHSKDASVQQIAEVLRTDPATSAKLLRLVNSPYFGIPGGITDIARAIPFVGFNTLYQLVLSITVAETFGLQGAPIDLRPVWVHSLSVASAAREVAAEITFPDAGSCFTAGLLHDIGKIALPWVSPEKLAKAQAAVAAEGISMRAAEQRLGILPHEVIGSRLAKQWRFPLTLASAIEYHHTIHRPEVRSRVAAHLRPMAEIVGIAHSLATRCESTFGACTSDEHEADDPSHMQELCEIHGLSNAQLGAICDRTRSQLERSKMFLSLL
jgi:putative nucleotidyltransferase with HDIG domain